MEQRKRTRNSNNSRSDSNHPDDESYGPAPQWHVRQTGITIIITTCNVRNYTSRAAQLAKLYHNGTSRPAEPSTTGAGLLDVAPRVGAVLGSVCVSVHEADRADWWVYTWLSEA
ncbi:Hypothetical predicted protein [Marmota monax]|uniref:Uncharacterized protein n=1 Tax=Marmota monax TaxID=9995 RepID=A0A5E4A1T1_MARMO|nr:Hypothetical predicted protein [Marmota monax]